MRSFSRARVVLATTAVALTAIVAACSSPPPPPPPVVQAPPPPPPITLSSQVIERASAFRGYMARAAAISPTFQNGDQIQVSLKVGAAYEPKSLMNGAVAYAAVMALQDPTFVASVREVAAHPAQRQEMINNIFSNPSYATVFKGADSAAGLIIDQLGGDGLKVYVAGKAVKQAAYDVQRSSWSKSSVSDRDARLASAKTLSTAPALAESADVAVLQQASLGGQTLGLTPRAAPAPYQPVVIRGLAVAALAALGAAGDNNLTSIDALSVDPATGSCLNMAKLNLYQCLAVSKPHYEDIFCLGQHILMDTGACMAKAAGAALPPEPPPPPKIETTVKTKAKKVVRKSTTKKS
ncbi:hypothetical protein B7G68_02840 [Caulobacter segnis]|uniref:Lipoprotein n=2 Tax=Caulobacter segnis TaxID=88688 RepID=D5VHT4_CAUST|nr:hypothetical protein [Caulobacter segnis]ADG09065.1 conserved hypothetical protein [Caulobacter segnis ATCC 21756]AVQ00888.1 hypothetical protein B7G68_02840 [Caulobacter segnis]